MIITSHIVVETQDVVGTTQLCWRSQDYYRMAHALSSSTKVRKGAAGNISVLDLCSDYF
jgi:hypothetical protein